jgi:hypothetical protein
MGLMPRVHSQRAFPSVKHWAYIYIYILLLFFLNFSNDSQWMCIRWYQREQKWNETVAKSVYYVFSEMPHPLWRIKLCAIIRWSLQLHYKNPPPDALGVGGILHLRREGPYTYIIKSESDLWPNILKSGPISIYIGIRSTIPLLRI